jgi:predicted alpha-1,6-mannanase (GH76 family)
MRAWPLPALVLATLVAVPAAQAADLDASRARQSETALVVQLDTRTDVMAWPLSQAVTAALAIAALPDATSDDRATAARLVARLAQYNTRLGYSSQRYGEVYYDDNEWIALALLDWYRLSGDRRALVQAKRIFGIVLSAWDGRKGVPCGGGIYWMRSHANRDRNTVTTGAGALLALRLAAVDPNPAYRWWAVRMLRWLDACLRAPDGLYYDHFRRDGTIDRTEWSYNQGNVIGALLALGDSDSRAGAETLAAASLRWLDPAHVGEEPPEFVAVLARNLLALGTVDLDPRWRAAVEAYADAAWTRPLPRLLDRAAVTQLYAALAATTAP